ncbi:hypothetical protein EC968_007617, partial [Mortierella alpina]
MSVIVDKLVQQDQCIKEHTGQIQRQDAYIRRIETEFRRLDELLREYYLEMDLASVDNPSTNSHENWYSRIRALRFRNKRGKDD